MTLVVLVLSRQRSTDSADVCEDSDSESESVLQIESYISLVSRR